jgi:hypothetical protein
MGLFGISLPNPLHVLSSAAHWVGHEASDAGHFIADHVTDLKYLSPAYYMYQAGKWLFEKCKEHWKTLVTIAVGALVFTAVVTVIVLSGGTATALVTVVVAGALSGAASQTTQDLLDGKTPGWDVARSAATSAIFAGVSWGALRVAQPVLEPLADRIPIVAKLGLVQGGAGASDPIASAGAQAARNAVAKAVVAEVDPAESGDIAAVVEREAVQFKEAVATALKKVRPSPTKVATLFSNDPDRSKETKKPPAPPVPTTPGFVNVFREDLGDQPATPAAR